ncbi:dolichyldiphosphatase 1 isoform X1 [Otolemur garnettii]|uniref:dolichyldiphosphatase 1 isoform X1 n=1 Tax=Otolemur garnettii TaxID=30611 RepID=UPI000C7F3FB2|nr:dolichyldiphosphatase 1 isoform X1 [Otolemur garnettii]
MAADGQCSLPASWRPVTLTHVEYPAGDLSGHLLAYLSLSPIFVIVGFVTLIIFKRELHTISFLGGLALNEGVNWLIKNIIQEPRPCGGRAWAERALGSPRSGHYWRATSSCNALVFSLSPGPHTAVGTKYGMPSSHSQFMWFFSIYSFLFLYLRMHQTNNARFLDLLWRHLLSLGLLTVAFLVSYSRVYLLYHTWSQVLYGGIAGSFMAVAWFIFTQEVLTPLFPRIAAWPISEFFLIRDTSLIPNVLWFEYTVTRAEARNRQRKLGTKLQ